MAMEVSIMLFIFTHTRPPPPHQGEGMGGFAMACYNKKPEKAMKEGEVEVNRPQSQAQ